MPGFLLDTNVLSEFKRKNAPDRRVLEWLDRADRRSVFVSVATLSEIRFGIELLSQGQRRSQLELWLEHDLQYWFEGRILAVDQEIGDTWGRLRARAQRNGRSMPIVDALLAATAQCHNLTVVSRNEVDFIAAGLAVLNPWIAQRSQ